MSDGDADGERQSGTYLLIDDDPTIHDLVAAVLVDEDVVRMTSKKEFLNYRQAKPLAVLLDLNLPDGHGIDLIESIRDRWSNVVIIVLTGDRRPETISRALSAGADDYVSKPFEPVEFLARTEARIKWRMSLSQPKMRTFKDFELDTERRVVRGPMGIAPLSLRSTQLLIELMTVRVCRPRRSLMRRLWPDRTVSQNSLDQLTSEVRSALSSCGSSLTVKSFDGERVCLVEAA